MLASSRGPRAAANTPGGYRIRPYNGFPAPETCGFPGICGTYKMTVGRDALIPPHPAPPRTPAGGINPSPTNHGKVRGQPGNRKPCAITNPCRGRCSHRPGQPRHTANAPGGYGIRPYNGFLAPETRGFPGICGTDKTTVGRDALIPPHPAPPQPPPRCGVHKRVPCNTRQTLPNTIKSAGPIRKENRKDNAFLQDPRKLSN